MYDGLTGMLAHRAFLLVDTLVCLRACRSTTLCDVAAALTQSRSTNNHLEVRFMPEALEQLRRELVSEKVRGGSRHCSFLVMTSTTWSLMSSPLPVTLGEKGKELITPTPKAA